MSETRDLIAAVLAAREPVFSDRVRNLRSGRWFQSEIEAVVDIEANALLGRDARESVIFHVRDRNAAMDLRINDTIEAIGSRFMILRRSDNPGSPQVDFGAMKITEKDV